jgi:tripartite-type tricarboxylate transporter receptor subunit TctC
MGLASRCIAFIASLLIAMTAAQAQPSTAYPSRTIRIIVPFPAGGPTDVHARILAQRMSEDWGQPVVVENRPGANTAIGAQHVARSAADGYTILAAMDATLVMNPATMRNLPYDPFKDFAAIALLAKGASVLSVRADDGPKSLKDLIAIGRANPGKLNYGAGIITSRLGGYMFNQAAGITAQLIPYKGSAENVQGLLTGAVDYIFDGTPSVLPLVQAGKIRPLAKMIDRHLPALPDLPSIRVAADLPTFDDTSTWTAFVAPAGTPRSIIEKIHRQVVTMYADPAMADRLEKAGLLPEVSTPDELDAFFRKEAVRWAAALKESGMAVD